MRVSFYIKRRVKPIKYSGIIVPIGSIILALIISSILLLLSNINPLYLYQAIASSAAEYSTLRYSIPLILAGVGLAIAYRANVWNIGSEGQILAGAVITTWLALYILPHEMPSSLALAILYISGFIAGAFLALIPAILKVKFGVNEVLSTLMLNYIMLQLTNYLVYGPWRGLKEYGYPRSDIFPKNMWIPQIPRTSIHYPTLIIAVILSILTFILIYKTKTGYEIRVLGSNPDAAKYSGMNIARIIIIAMLLSGGFAGIAGVGEVAGVHRQLIRAEMVSAGFGYTAIIVAWLAKLNPLVIILTGYFIGILVSASYTLQIFTGVSYGSVNVITGILLISLISLEFLSRYKPVVKIIR